MASRFDDVTITGTLTVGESSIAPQLRSSVLKQSDNFVFPVGLTTLRVWDARATNLPSSASSDDLGLITGTWGTNPLRVQAGDLKAAGATTRYAAFEVIVPESYVAAETFSIVVYAGMTTTVADTTCTVDIEAYRRDKLGALSADLCSTSAQSINSLTIAAKTFNITAATLTPGDTLECRVAIACTDAATGTAVTPTITQIDRVCDIKG